MPLVRVALFRENAADITIDQDRGIGIAVEHLARLGHRRIGLICEPRSTQVGRRNETAFAQAMARLGLAGDGRQLDIARFQARHPASASEACLLLCSRPERPTALVVTDDSAAMGCYGALRTRGLRVPDDVSIVGWGDSEPGPFIVPPLTTISVPLRAAATRAAARLLAILGDGARLEPQVLLPHLVQRASTTFAHLQ